MLEGACVTCGVIRPMANLMLAPEGWMCPQCVYRRDAALIEHAHPVPPRDDATPSWLLKALAEETPPTPKILHLPPENPVPTVADRLGFKVIEGSRVPRRRRRV